MLVTTKEGKKGKAVLDYEFTYGIQNPSNKISLLGSEDYMTLINEQAANSGKDPYFTGTSKFNTDWQEALQNKTLRLSTIGFRSAVARTIPITISRSATSIRKESMLKVTRTTVATMYARSTTTPSSVPLTVIGSAR